MITFITIILALLSIAGTIATVVGFRASFREVGEHTWWFMMGFSAFAMAYNLRSMYWDVFWTGLKHYDRATALDWSEATGGTAINILFYSVVLIGIFCVLKSRQLMIPVDERSAWPWWKGWMHPKNLGFNIWKRKR